jgi:hypothetical protein
MFENLFDILARIRQISIDELNFPENKGLAIDIQTKLCDLGILDPSFGGDVDTPFGPVSKGDGRVGLNTRNAIFEFCRLCKSMYTDGILTIEQLRLLNEAQAETLVPVDFDNKASDDADTRLAKRILRYMRRKGYWIARSPNAMNIVYVEGMNEDGTLNTDTFNEWNDRRMVIQINKNGQPNLVVNHSGTTEPGDFYTRRPLNPNGAARIAFGQYKAWVDGLHQGWQPALVQRADVRVHRDLNKNGKRNASDPMDVGSTFGINQHTTSRTKTPDLIGPYSAGCLVGRRWDSHESFLQRVFRDYRYQMNKGYLFITAVIPGDDLVRLEPR